IRIEIGGACSGEARIIPENVAMLTLSIRVASASAQRTCHWSEGAVEVLNEMPRSQGSSRAAQGKASYQDFTLAFLCRRMSKPSGVMSVSTSISFRAIAMIRFSSVPQERNRTYFGLGSPTICPASVFCQSARLPHRNQKPLSATALSLYGPMVTGGKLANVAGSAFSQTCLGSTRKPLPKITEPNMEAIFRIDR